MHDEAKLNAYYELAKEIRGTFMEQAIWIDHILSDTLAHYFCADKTRRAILFSEVIAGVDSRFSTRIALLFSVLQHLHPQVYEAKKKFRERLDKIRRFRNRLAHSHLKATDAEFEKAREGAVTFCFYEDGSMKEQVVSVADIQERLAETSDAVRELLEIRSLLLPDYDRQA